MSLTLTLEQTRILGVLLEKEATTPDQYPMSLNGVMTACNQKSNREPIVNYDDGLVQSTLDELRELRLVTEITGARVVKYKHRLAGSEFSELNVKPAETAILCVLFLRGPQTPGELRTRCQRLFAFDDVAQVEASLTALADREQGALVQKLEREPGKREARYLHLLGDEQATQAAIEVQATSASGSATQAQRIEVLESEVATLKAELANIKQELGL